MKYSDVDLYNGFQQNMRQTSWTRLFPSWWSEDALTTSIGKEIELIKSMIIFQSLEAGIKPPVLLWQTSLDYKEKQYNKNITSLPDNIEITAPLYKTWGNIQIVNNSDEDIYNLKIMFTDNDGITLNHILPAYGTVFLDLTNQKFYINDKKIKPLIYGKGLQYFITTRNNDVYDPDTPLHNEIVRLQFSSISTTQTDLDITVTMDNVVFKNEQNIEITGLELLPIRQVDLYAKYEFPYNSKVNGWKKVYQKKYIENTDVIYDMITTHFYTKEFYVEVWFDNLSIPYTVGFPCFKDAEPNSKYHVYDKLDEYGELLGLQRRDYRTTITEEEYPFTYPQYYPFDIEQDYWYYKRLISEYCENNLAIDNVDITDTNGDTVIRLHSINPFVEDFAIYANSNYPKERENIDYHEYTPSYIFQDTGDTQQLKQARHYNIENLLKKDDNYSYVTLQSKSGNHISYETNQSKQLGMYFDLSNLPQDVHIDGFEIILDAESMDNSKNKYTDSRTSLQISDTNTIVGKINETGFFGLERSEVIYGDKHTLFGIDKVISESQKVYQKITIGPFRSREDNKCEIPFIYEENDTIIDKINDVMILYYNKNNECIDTSNATYHVVDLDNKKNRFLKSNIPAIDEVSYITILSTTGSYYPFSVTVNTKIDVTEITETNKDSEDTDKVVTDTIFYIAGPYNIDTKVIEQQVYTNAWDTGDLRDLIQQHGLYFIYALTNDDYNATSTVLLYNVTLRIYHSPKKSTIDLKTSIDKSAKSPFIGNLNVNVTNIGEKPVKTMVDIINAPNLSLETNYIDIDLNVGDSVTSTIPIRPEYPIVDGLYEILTICENKEHKDYVKIESAGLVKTSINMKPHFGKYNEDIVLSAELKNILKTRFDSDKYKMSFYIDNIYIGSSSIINNKATYTINPSEIDFLDAGMHSLTAKFDGSPKYATSRTRTDLFISKKNVKLTLTADETALYNTNYTVKVEAQLLNNEGIYEPLQEGSISVYIDDELQYTKDIVNGVMENTSLITLNKAENSMAIKAGKHTLKVQYNDTELYYSMDNLTQPLIIVGGETKIGVFDIQTHPLSNIDIKAKITDANGYPVTSGTFTFSIYDGETLLDQQSNISLSNSGLGEITYYIGDVLDTANIEDIKTYNVKVEYQHANTVYENSTGYGTITVKRQEVIIQHTRRFNASQHEPIGFYMKVIDASTGEGINDITYDPITNEKQYNSKIYIDIPSHNINLIADVEEDGVVTAIYKPITFSAEEWNELVIFENGQFIPKTTFEIKDSSVDDPLYAHEPTPRLPHEDVDLYRIYNGDLPNLNLMNFSIIDGELWYTGKDDISEQIYIGSDGHLYARASIDNLGDMEYEIGIVPIEITYISKIIYKNQKLTDSTLHITSPIINIDMHSYDLTYGQSELITCFVTEYTWDLTTETQTVNRGEVYFFVDNTYINKVEVNNGLAVLSQNALMGMKHGHHLLTAEYIDADNNKHTYTYTNLYIRPNPASISYTFHRVLKNKKSTIDIDITSNNNVTVTGNVYLYVDGKTIASRYLYGKEDGHVSIDFTIPDTENKTLTIEYEGNNYIESSIIRDIPLIPDQVEVNINATDCMVATGNNCTIDITVNSSYNDDIDEGSVALYSIPNNISDSPVLISSANVHHNFAQISWNAPNTVGEVSYELRYENGINFINNTPYIYTLTVVNPFDEVYVTDDDFDKAENPSYFNSLNEAISCIAENGTVYIIDNAIITHNININKNINIIGYNGATINKNIPNLITNNNDIVVHNTNFDANLKLIPHLSLSSLSAYYYCIIDKELYYINNVNELIPVFLCNDGRFYAYVNIDKTSTSIHIDNNVNVFIQNVTIKNDDAEDTFNIYNYGNLQIIRSILDESITLSNYNDLTINRSLVYCPLKIVDGSYNLDNNWWGSNTAPYQVNNHIILTIDTDTHPPVLGEDFNVHIQLIGKNGTEYDIPGANFTLTSDNGYLQIASGILIDHQMSTLYVDGFEEGKIYATVDNETVSLQVYDYDRKTEVIFDDIDDVPSNYQIPISVKVQSCADVFYEFDSNNNIIKSSNSINDGFVTFYLYYDNTKHQVGKSVVKNGQAQCSIFFSDNYYNIGTYTVIAEYHDSEYYFNSDNTKDIHLIDNHNVCYVSPFGDNNHNGQFDTPVQTIQQALNLGYKTIYLKDGDYADTHIIIDDNVTIKKYNGTVTFNDNDDIIFINNNILHLVGFDFTNNHLAYLIQNNNKLTCTNCIFTNNQLLVNTLNDVDTQFVKCAIVNNNGLANVYTNVKTSYCWFGTNDPMSLNMGDYGSSLVFDDETQTFSIANNNEFTPFNVNDYIIMELECSKDIIYLGDIARLTATLHSYMHDGVKTPIHDDIPLRIAKFATTYGSLMPIKDYTHSNKATTLLNTNEATNSIGKVFIDIDENTNYINNNVKLSCHVYDIADNNIHNEDIRFTVTDKNNNILINAVVNINDGIALLNDDTIFLPQGEYLLTCTYSNDYNVFTNSKMFTVNIPKINLNNIYIDNNDHIYSINFYAEAIDSFGNPVDNQKVNFYIDNNIIYTDTSNKNSTFIIKNGVLSAKLMYPEIPVGNYKLKITTQDLPSDFDVLDMDINIKAQLKPTIITCEQNSMQKAQPTTLLFNITDNEYKPMNDGTLTVFINDNPIYIDDIGECTFTPTDNNTFIVTDGIVKLKSLTLEEEGQYSITAYYSGVDNYYQDAIYIDNKFNVGLYPVNINSDILQQQLTTHLVNELDLSFQITDIANNIVKHGYVNLYIDGVKINNENINISHGYINYNINISQLKIGKHTFTIEYIDNNNTFLDTILNTTLQIKPIETSILVDTIYSAPNHTVDVEYQIESSLGAINTGTLTAYLGDKKLNTVDVSNAVNHTISLDIGNLPTTDNYQIHFVYNDDRHIYKSSEADVLLIINYNTINISTPTDYYYPNELINFTVNFRDIYDNIIDIGEATLYIDNVKEGDTQTVHNGQINIPLRLNKVKDYNISIIYASNDYYAETTYDKTISVNNIPINSINLSDPLVSQPGQTLETNIIFNIEDTNHHVNDGIVDFYFDGNKINSYYVSDNDNIVLNIPNVNSGEYDLVIQYYNSDIYTPYRTTKKFTIQKYTTTLNTYIEGDASLTNDITIKSTLANDATGFIKYYMGINEENMSMIGVDTIINGESAFIYTLPKTLDYNQYIIKSEYSGDGKYDIANDTCELNITPVTPTISIEDIEAKYQDVVEFKVHTNIHDNVTILFYINDKNIGSVVTDMNGDGVYEYLLPNMYTAGTYNIKAYYMGSAVINEALDEGDLIIEPYTPTINAISTSDNIEAHIGEMLVLDSQVIGNNDVLLNTGSVKYILNENDPIIISPNDIYSIPLDASLQNTLTMVYESSNENAFCDVTKTYNIIMKRNDLTIKIDNQGPITRGIDFVEHVTFSSDTTLLPIDIDFDIDGQEFTTSNGQCTATLNIPLSNDDANTYDITISYDGDNIFNSITQTFTIKNTNANEVTTNNNINISKAIDLINNNGTINISADITNENNITNNKNIIIDGQQHILNNIHIVNDGNLTLRNCTVKNCNTAIINNGTLIVEDCIFEDCTDSVIITNNNIHIDKCTFINNTTVGNDKQKYGACIYINNQNHQSYITNCEFRSNTAHSYGGAIYSNKGNDIIIQNCKFYKNNANIHGSCIAINGHAYIADNLFYKNQGNSDIYLINGNISSETNVFDGNHIIFRNINGDISANMTYWGTNNLDDIETLYNGHVEIDTWLLSDNNINTDNKIIINKYQNRLEAEINSFNTIEYILPVLDN